MRSNIVRVLLLAFAVLAVATACGGASKHTSSPPPTTTTTSASTTAKTVTRSHPKGTTSTGATGQSTTSRSSFASPGHCTLMRALGAKVSQSVPVAFHVSRTNITAETAALRAFAGAAPSEIRGAFNTYIDVFHRYMQAYASAGLKPGKAPTKAQYARIKTAATIALNTPGLAAAEQHLKRWVRANCPKVPAKN